MRKNSNIWVLFQLKIFVLAEHRVSSHSDPLWLQRVLRYCTSQTVLKKQTSKPSEAAWGTISRTETYFKDRLVPPEELLTPSYSISSICIRSMLSKKKKKIATLFILKMDSLIFQNSATEEIRPISLFLSNASQGQKQERSRYHAATWSIFWTGTVLYKESNGYL